MATLIKAAGVTVEPIWTTLFAKALQGETNCILDGLNLVPHPVFVQQAQIICHMNDKVVCEQPGTQIAQTEF